MSVAVPPDASDDCGQQKDTHLVCACKRPRCAAPGSSSANCDSWKETLRHL